jgi:PLP dependent protein
MISDQIAVIRENIRRVCQKVGRDPEEVTLVGVTKFATVENIKEAVAAGVTDIGENRVQAAREKFFFLPTSPSVRRHMIGHLQTNKVKVALELFDLIQSVDSLLLAEEIQKQAKRLDRMVDILVQVDCSGEMQKFGVPKDEALTLVGEINQLPNIIIRGLMTIAPFVDDEAVIRNCFRDLRVVRDRVNQDFAGAERVMMQYLSMGMSHDYLIALEESANMLRIGAAIFAGKKEE